MDKIERVDRVLQGLEVDRPPVSLWYHFGVQHAGGDQFAGITLQYFKTYDFDFLKVMNDYFYPPPAGLDAVKSKEGLKRITPFEVQNSDWKEQFRALELIAEALRNDAYFIDTVFDPWQSIKRNMAGENIKALMADEPGALLEALDVVTDNLTAYCKKSLEIGAAGIFMSIPAAAEIVSRQEFQTFVKPFAMRVFEAISGLGIMNTAHIHGENLFFEDVLDFPVDIFNWWDRGPNGPSLGYVKQRIRGCVMGGIDQTIVARNTRAFLKEHVREGIELGGHKRFFLANGCSIPSWVYPGAVHAIVAAAKAGRKS
ncbi:MAG: uroporphyrinogen decarboxylase family protein [Desulfobacterales bacterium]|jgi:uroporphyrinogen decarboxylase